MKSLYRLFAFSLLIVLFAPVSNAGDEKVEICHFPPGNTANIEIISVSQSSAEKHFQMHQDMLYVDGQCLTSYCTACVSTAKNVLASCTELFDSTAVLILGSYQEDLAICEAICDSGACEHQPGETPDRATHVEENLAGRDTCIEQTTSDRDEKNAENEESYTLDCVNEVTNLYSSCISSNRATAQSCSQDRTASQKLCEQIHDDDVLATIEEFNECTPPGNDPGKCFRSLKPGLSSLILTANLCSEDAKSTYDNCTTMSACPTEIP